MVPNHGQLRMPQYELVSWFAGKAIAAATLAPITLAHQQVISAKDSRKSTGGYVFG